MTRKIDIEVDDTTHPSIRLLEVARQVLRSVECGAEITPGTLLDRLDEAYETMAGGRCGKVTGMLDEEAADLRAVLGFQE